MPDLTNDPIGSNYRRAEQRFSNFGTRRLRFYTIEIDGYDIFDNENFTEEFSYNYETTGDDGDDGDYAYKNPPKSIIEAILRGVSLVAETYYVSWWRVEYDGPYPYLYITVAVAGDTFLDANNQPNNGNPNSIGLQDSIANALGNNFNWDQVLVWPAEIQGDNLSQQNAPFAMSREKVQISEARKTERTARLDNPKTARVSRRG